MNPNSGITAENSGSGSRGLTYSALGSTMPRFRLTMMLAMSNCSDTQHQPYIGHKTTHIAMGEAMTAARMTVTVTVTTATATATAAATATATATATADTTTSTSRGWRAEMYLLREHGNADDGFTMVQRFANKPRPAVREHDVDVCGL